MSGDLNARDIAGLGHRVQRAYANESLNSAQRERHLRRVSDAQRNLGATGPGLRLHRAELSVIAAVAVLALVGVFGWQALRPTEDEWAASGGSTPAAAHEPAAAIEVQDDAGFYEGRCVFTPYSNEGPPDASQADFTWTWFGDDTLWAGLGPENQGFWSANEMRVLWWREVPAALEVTGTRLDSDAPLLEADIFAGYDGLSHQITTLRFPEPGCWEVVGQAGDQELRFVVDVLPMEEGPAYQALQEEKVAIERERQSLLTQPLFGACEVSAWRGPEFRMFGVSDEPPLAYWIDGEGMSLGTPHGVLFTGENQLVWLVEPGMSTGEMLEGEISVEGVHERGWLAPLDATIGRQIPADWIDSDAVERGWHSTLTFPERGCWDIIVTAGPHTLEAKVYVYSTPEKAPAPAEEQGVALDDLTAFAEPTGFGEGRHVVIEVATDVRDDEGSLLHWEVEFWDRTLDSGTRQQHAVARMLDSDGEVFAEFINAGEDWYWEQRGWVESGSGVFLEPPAEIWLAMTEPRAVGTYLSGPPEYDEIEFAEDNRFVNKRVDIEPVEDVQWVADMYGFGVARYFWEIELDQTEQRVRRSERVVIGDNGQRVSLGAFIFHSIELLDADDMDDDLFVPPSAARGPDLQYTVPQVTLPRGLRIEVHIKAKSQALEQLELVGDGIELEVTITPSRGGLDVDAWTARQGSDSPAHTSVTDDFRRSAWQTHPEYGWPAGAAWSDGHYRFDLTVTSEPGPDLWTEDDLLALVEALSYWGQ